MATPTAEGHRHPTEACKTCGASDFVTLPEVSLALWPAAGGYSEATDGLRFHVHICLSCGGTAMFAAQPRAASARIDAVMVTIPNTRDPYR